MNSFLSFQVHGNAENPGIAGATDKFLTFLESLLDKSLTEIFGLIFPGISALPNLHPLLVHFPIALLSCFFIFDLAATLAKKPTWREHASYFLYFGTLSAGLAVIAGFVAEESIPHGNNVHGIMERHEALGISVLGLSVLLSGWRLKSGVITGEINILHQILAALLCILISLGADLGGLMVYKYGVAVEPVTKTNMDFFQEHSHDPAESHDHNHAH